MDLVVANIGICIKYGWRKDRFGNRHRSQSYIFFCVRFRFVSLFLKYTPDFCVKVRGFYLLQVYCTSGIIFDGPGPAPSHPPRLHIIPVNDELTKWTRHSLLLYSTQWFTAPYTLNRRHGTINLNMHHILTINSYL